MTKAQEKIWAFAFGTTFLVAILAIAMIIPNPTVFQIFVFRVILSLSAAGVAALVPGFLSVNLSNIVRAGGALAIFVLVYFLNPAQLVSTFDPGEEPVGSAKNVSDNYLLTADKLDPRLAWLTFSKAARSYYKESEFEEAFASVRVPLGEVKFRKFVGFQSTNHVPGWPVSHYRVYQYQTIFYNDQIRNELVTVMSESNKWLIAAHVIH